MLDHTHQAQEGGGEVKIYFGSLANEASKNTIIYYLNC